MLPNNSVVSIYIKFPVLNVAHVHSYKIIFMGETKGGHQYTHLSTHDYA